MQKKKNKSSLLLVEGETDVDFFDALLKKLNMQDRVKISPPRDYDRKNTVTVIPELTEIIINKQLRTGQVLHLGIVADADYASGSGAGFQERWKQLTRPLTAHNYRIPQTPPKLPYLGSIFRHSDLPSIGLWLMPDHKNDGLLEDLIFKTIKRDENQKKLLNKSQEFIKSLPTRLFKPSHKTKAVIYSWLAWQKRPGLTLDVIINGSMVDLESTKMKSFIKWLYDVFDIKQTL